ncbi:MAG: zinc ribbon domain-containing protein [Candidatus Acidiferrales bacterium]
MKLLDRDSPTSLTTAPRDPATVTIVNIGDQDFYISRTYGIFHIPACAKGEPFALLLVTSRGDALDLGDNRRFPFTITAREIADDLIQDLDGHGIFVCAGARPTDEELSTAAAKRAEWYQQLVAEADTMWARGHSYREISDMHRRAALSLGTERDWAFVPQKLIDCPACGEHVKPSVAVCKHCGAVLDAEKAAKHGLGNRA